MSGDDYRTPEDLTPRCPRCKTSDRVQPLEDHPRFPWICDGCDLTFTGTPAEFDRYQTDRALTWAEREHPSDDWEPGAAR